MTRSTARYSYRAFGLLIESELELPELIPAAEPQTRADPDAPPLRVVFGEVRPLCDGAPFGSRVPSADRYLVWDDLGAFLVRGGAEIVVEPAAGVHPELVRMMVLGRCLGAALTQRGWLVLHASTARLDDRIVALCGSSGAGKSTLAAALYGAGCPVLSDDLLPVRIAHVPGSAPRASGLAGFGQLKLSAEPAQRFEIAEQALPRLHPEIPERYYPAPRGFCSGELPLAGVYLIDREAPLGVAMPLQPSQACVELLRFTYAVDLLRDRGAQGRHFETCADLAMVVPVSRLHCGSDVDALPGLLPLLRADLAEG